MKILDFEATIYPSLYSSCSYRELNGRFMIDNPKEVELFTNLVHKHQAQYPFDLPVIGIGIMDYEIKRVIFNEPATIVLWKDGTKTVVKCSDGDTYDKEKGLALCFMKKALGNKGNFNYVLKEHTKCKE